MKINRRNTFLLIVSLLLFAVTGCSLPEEQVGIIIPPKSNPPEEAGSAATRFSESTSKNPTVVESAIELSEKYAKLSNETATLKQKNRELAAENRRVNDKLSSAEAELLQTQKELTEANDLLIEMRVELNNWKTNILGFREEMREADTEQLRALLNILKILGGEVKTDSNKDNDKGQDSGSVNSGT